MAKRKRLTVEDQLTIQDVNSKLVLLEMKKESQQASIEDGLRRENSQLRNDLLLLEQEHLRRVQALLDYQKVLEDQAAHFRGLLTEAIFSRDAAIQVSWFKRFREQVIGF